jgi:phytoene dehydrogenase-like protein
MRRYDAIVIGAGHNGLVAAAALGKAGKRVLILERRDRIGGMASSVELEPGVMVPTCAHIPFGVRPEIAKALDLSSHGLFYGAKRPATISLCPLGRHVKMVGDEASGIGWELDKGQAAAFAALRARLRKYAKTLSPMILRTPPRFAGNALNENLALGKLGLTLKRLGRADMREFLRIVMSNVHDVILDEIEDGPLAGAFALEALLGGHVGPRSPGTVLNLLYRLAGETNGEAGLRMVPDGGVAALIQALEKAAVSVGVEISTGASVAQIEVGEDDRVAGVRLENGEWIEAPLVLAGVAPKIALLKMLGASHLDAEFVRRCRHVPTKGSAARLDLVLTAAPQVAGVSAPELPARFVIAPSIAQTESAFNPAKYGKWSSEPVLEFSLSQLEDGRCHLSAVMQYIPYDLEGGWSEAARAAVLESALKRLDPFLPDLRKSLAVSRLATPADIEADFNAPGGHWHHGELRVEQMLMLRPFAGAARYRMPVGGLYLCSAGAHPGGDISGAPGWNAAHQAIADERSGA